MMLKKPVCMISTCLLVRQHLTLRWGHEHLCVGQWELQLHQRSIRTKVERGNTDRQESKIATLMSNTFHLNTKMTEIQSVGSQLFRMPLNKIKIIRHLEKQLKANHERAYLEMGSKPQRESPLSLYSSGLWLTYLPSTSTHGFFLADVSPFFPLEAIPSQAMLTLVCLATWDSLRGRFCSHVSVCNDFSISKSDVF